MMVNSVTGPIDTADLGVTLMHEHVVNLDFNMCNAFPDWFDRETTMRQFTDEIARVKPHGLKTFVDCTPINLGRDIHIMKEAAERAGVQMLVSTGMYYMQDPWSKLRLEAEELAHWLMKDAEEGIQGTGIKPALIKCATDKIHGASDINREMLRGIAITAKRSGLPVYTHSVYEGRTGLYQLDVLCGEGVEPHRIIVGHTFDACDTEYLESMLRQGVYVGCDRIGLEIVCATDKLADCVARLIERGWHRQIILSHDANITSDFAHSFTSFRRDRTKNKAVGAYYEIFEVMIPMLLEKGVTREIIDDILIGNPRRYFEGQPVR